MHKSTMQTLKRGLLFGVFSMLTVTLTGCEAILPGVYKIDIQQGNQLKAEDIAKLRPGMTQKQVTYVLGTPPIQDPFFPNRWDYVYRLKAGDGTVTQRHVTVTFKNGYVEQIQRHKPSLAATPSPETNS